MPFGVRGGTLKAGRRNVMHEYPYRDDRWVEDLGRNGRRISITGFLAENAAYGGGDVIAQRTAMIAACEQAPDETAGSGGEFVHPSLGCRTVFLLDFECEERTELGRAFELRFPFIQSGTQQFPTRSSASAIGSVCSFWRAWFYPPTHRHRSSVRATTTRRRRTGTASDTPAIARASATATDARGYSS